MGLKTKILSKFPRLYLLTKPNKTTLDNLKAYNIIKKHQLLDENYYLKEYPDVKKAGMNPIIHYMLYGHLENKKPSTDFDPIYYKHKYNDAYNSKLNPLTHYALYGLKENREYKLTDNTFQTLTPNEIREKTKNYEKTWNTRRRILYIVHEPIGSFGGTGYTTTDIIQDIQKDYDCYILTSTGETLELWNKTLDNYNKLAQWKIQLKNNDLSNEKNIQFKKQTHNQELRKIYATILLNLNIDLIHINHILNHTHDITELAKQYQIPVTLSIHDFYYICPSIHLINHDNEYCKQKCQQNDYTCQYIPDKTPTELKEILTDWQEKSKKFLNNTTQIITPSNSTKQTYLDTYPKLKDKITTITHGRNLQTINYTPKLEKPARILFPGYIGTHKGSLLIKKIKEQDTENNLELHFMGTTYPSLKKYGKNHGRYKREDFHKFVKNIKPSFIGIFSTVPETYSHTLTEAWNTNTPVIATKLGALEERIKQTQAGYLIPYNQPTKAYNEIIKITEDSKKYTEIQENTRKIKPKTQTQMTREYKQIYDKLTQYTKPKHLLTVIIPTYNTGQYLKESIGSLMNQTIGFNNIEVIIVDDKSTDQDTINLINEYAEKYENIHAIFLEKNTGFPGYPRNTGIKHSHTDYIIVMDHDDSYQPDALEKLYTNITRENADIAICNFNQVFQEGTIPYKPNTITQPIVKVKNIQENPNLLTLPAAIWTRLYRKKFLQDNHIKFLEGMLAEDVYLNNYTLLKAQNIIYLNNYHGYQYKIRDTQEDKSTIHIRNKKYINAILDGLIETSKLITTLHKEQYTNLIFKPHLTSWLYTIVLSNTTDKEKLELYKKATPLYQKRYTDDPYFQKRYLKLVEYIQNQQYDKAIIETHKIKEKETNMNEKLIQQIRKEKKQ